MRFWLSKAHKRQIGKRRCCLISKNVGKTAQMDSTVSDFLQQLTAVDLSKQWQLFLKDSSAFARAVRSFPIHLICNPIPTFVADKLEWTFAVVYWMRSFGNVYGTFGNAFTGCGIESSGTHIYRVRHNGSFGWALKLDFCASLETYCHPKLFWQERNVSVGSLVFTSAHSMLFYTGTYLCAID